MPDFDIYGGWRKPNEQYSVAANTPTIEINSGQFNKIIMGNGMGTNAVSNLQKTQPLTILWVVLLLVLVEL